MKYLLLTLLIFSTASAQDYFEQPYDGQVIELPVDLAELRRSERFEMIPNPATFSRRELTQFLTSLKFEWVIVDTENGALIGFCPTILNPDRDNTMCNWMPKDKIDQLIGRHLAI